VSILFFLKKKKRINEEHCRSEQNHVQEQERCLTTYLMQQHRPRTVYMRSPVLGLELISKCSRTRLHNALSRKLQIGFKKGTVKSGSRDCLYHLNFLLIMAGVQAADSFEWFDCAALHGHRDTGRWTE
jgi:hypothetical protein